VILAVRDIGRRRQSELETLEWRRRYDLLTLAAGTSVYDCDLNGTVVWGGGIEQMLLGIPQRTLQGGLSQWMQRVHPDDAERVREQFTQAWSQGTRFRGRDTITGAWTASMCWWKMRTILTSTNTGKSSGSSACWWMSPIVARR